MTTIKQSGWEIEFNDEEPNRVYLRREGKPGDIHIKAEHEGYVIDIWPDGDALAPDAGCFALYQDLGDQQEEQP